MPFGCPYRPEEAPTMWRTIVKYCPIPARTEASARRLRADQRGVAGLVTAITATVLLGFCGLAIDVIMWQISQRGLQGAADQAALGAATAYRNAGETAALGDSQTAKNGAYATAIQSGYPAASVTAAAYNNAGTCINDGCLQVTITQQQQRFFTAIFLTQDVSESASAVGTCNGCGNGNFSNTIGGDACVMALDTSGSGVITDSGNATLSLVRCNLYNNSPNTSATIMNGGAVIEGCSATNACGSKAFLGQPDIPSHIDVPIGTNAAAAPDPYANLEPPSSSGCAGAPAFPSTSPVSSGTYAAGPDHQTVILNSGTYVFCNGWTINASAFVTGTGVTIYVPTGGSKMNGGSTVQISSPSTGQYAGMSLWFGDSSGVTWNGGNNSSFNGALYAPTATVTFEGNATGAASCTRLVSAAIKLVGTPTVKFDNSGCPALAAGPVVTASGVTGVTPYDGAPMLVQ
jgi:putative Flp pilus-assembly TadE/G-like protein